MDLGVFVHGDESIHVEWRVAGRLQRGIKERQQRVGQVPAHLLGVEAGVATSVGVVAPREFGERPGSTNGGVVGAEGGVDDESAIEHQTGVVDALEGVVVDPFTGEVDKNLKGE